MALVWRALAEEEAGAIPDHGREDTGMGFVFNRLVESQR